MSDGTETEEKKERTVTTTDENGNVIDITGEEYEAEAVEGRVVISGPGDDGKTTTITYDEDGNRISKEVEQYRQAKTDETQGQVLREPIMERYDEPPYVSEKQEEPDDKITPYSKTYKGLVDELKDLVSQKITSLESSKGIKDFGNGLVDSVKKALGNEKDPKEVKEDKKTEKAFRKEIKELKDAEKALEGLSADLQTISVKRSFHLDDNVGPRTTTFTYLQERQAIQESLTANKIGDFRGVLTKISNEHKREDGVNIFDVISIGSAPKEVFGNFKTREELQGDKVIEMNNRIERSPLRQRETDAERLSNPKDPIYNPQAKERTGQESSFVEPWDGQVSTDSVNPSSGLPAVNASEKSFV